MRPGVETENRQLGGALLSAAKTSEARYRPLARTDGATRRPPSPHAFFQRDRAQDRKATMGAAIRRGFDFLVRQGHKLGRIDFEDEPRRKVVGIMQLLGLVPQTLKPGERLIRSPRSVGRRDILR